ncbi:LemA family protein [Blattabacterium punctulatus]|uniref:LemA family protein n=1 Tax=Blattabacterium punctulatus TaxID=164514 RepID=UPI000D7C3F7E|nr:LemA family protein [Blattabacterium punctulatus]AWU42746.1 LemA family protein [Blattabacterium punctulatus]AWU43291.1 LemA family protein [Blattabacterium punctulatus]AWU46030.1 LemA family protein [Blattabacterium punctulatus]
MKRGFLIYISTIFIVIFLIIFWITGTYNQLVQLNENIKTQWSQVENAYQRRSDLIPNLVNIVKGSSNFEKNTLNQVIESRAKATSININPDNLNQNQVSRFQKSQEGLNNSINRLLLIVENYPNLKSTQNFYELQNQLEGTENRINVERNKFNDKVNNFNTYRNKFPKIIISNLFSQFKEKGYFKSKIGSEKAPIVDFDNS